MKIKNSSSKIVLLIFKIFPQQTYNYIDIFNVC